MKKRLLSFSYIAVIILLAAGCADSEPDSITSKTYDISDFTRLNLELIGEVQYVQADTSYLNVSGSSILIDALNVSDKNGKLSIELKNRQKYAKSKKELVINVSSPHLEEINFESIGSLHLKDFIQSDKLEVTNKGIGKIKIDDCHVTTFKLTSKSVGTIDANGTANEVYIHSEGVGNIDCSGLKANEAEVISKGTGNISVYAQEEINITAKGIGNVKYYGNPTKVKTDISGMGKASAMD